MSHIGLETTGTCTTTVTRLTIFYLSTCLLSLAAEAQEKKKPVRKVETWSYLERTGEKESSNNIIKSLRSTNLGAKRVATVSRLDSNNLEVTVWELQNDGSVEKLATAPAGTTTQAAIAALADKPELVAADKKKLNPMGHRFVTATRTEAGVLRLTVWDVDASGKTIVQGKSADALDGINGEIAIVTLGRNLVVTAVRNASDLLTLVSWQISENGSVQQLQTIPGEKVGKIALATYDSYPRKRRISKGEEGTVQLRTTRFATAVTIAGRKTNGAITDKSTGNLKVIAWSVDMAGSFTRFGELSSDPVKDVAASTLSYRRIVTAARNTGNKLEVRTWDFDEKGTPSLHGSAHDDEISDIDVTTLNGTRVITAARDPLSYVKLKVWDATDKVTYLGDAQATIAGFVSIVPLGGDWVLTPLITSASRLKLIAWMEHGVSLLRAEWGPSFPKVSLVSKDEIATPASMDNDTDFEIRDAAAPHGPEPQPTGPQPAGDGDPGITSPPTLAIPFEPEVEGKDPMIAVGFKYIIVSQQGKLGFFDKKGNPLKDKDDKWIFTTNEFFYAFLKGKRPDGSRNEHCINRHTQFPPLASTAYPPIANCDPDDEDSEGWPLPPGINGFYDTRVHFDPISRRFFIFAPARPCKLVKSNQCDDGGKNTNKPDNPRNRRYWAFAVSKTEDPRDGFYQWMSTEAYIADGPEFTVNQGVMVVSKEPWDLPYQPFGIKPVVYAISVEDLIKGHRYPRSHKFFKKDFPDYVKDLVPVTHYGDTAGRTFMVQSVVSDLYLYSFRNPSDWGNFSSVETTSKSIVSMAGTDVPVSSLWQAEHPKFRDAKIYFTWMKNIEPRVANGKNALWQIRVVRLPLKSLDTTPTASTEEADGYLYRIVGVGNHAPDDNAGDRVSYEIPTMAVNKHGHMVILYCRVGYEADGLHYPDTTNLVSPEARYSVYYADNRGLRHSRVLHKGKKLLVWTNDADEVADTAETIYTPEYRLDYQTAVIDPSDDLTIWMSSEFAGQDGYKTVVGKVNPEANLFPDLWIPYSAHYDSVIGMISATVENQGTTSSPKCSLRVIEQRPEDIDSIGGPWKTHDEYLAAVPALTVGQEVKIQVPVPTWSGGFDSQGNPIKHQRQWILKADDKNEVIEENEDNNGFVWTALN
jgi:hypothetical protein